MSLAGYSPAFELRLPARRSTQHAVTGTVLKAVDRLEYAVRRLERARLRRLACDVCSIRYARRYRAWSLRLYRAADARLELLEVIA